MTFDRDLARIGEQERTLQFSQFSLSDGRRLGTALADKGEAAGLGIAIDVSLFSMPVFYAALIGSTPDNPNWIRRKRNTVFRFLRSSYGMGLSLARSGETLQSKFSVPDADFASHGGSFPIVVKGTGCIGAVTVSGLPQRDDHAMVVEVLCAILGKDHATLALDAE